jgi:integrase
MVKIPYLQVFKDRHGKRRYYLRKPGLPRVALPDPKDKAAFIKAYNDAIGSVRRPSKAPGEGTMAALIAAFKAAPEWLKLKPASKYAYERQFAWLVTQGNFAEFPVSDITRSDIVRLRNKLVEKPATANLMISVVARLLQYGVELEWAKNNPAARMKSMDTGEYRSWTDAELAAFEARWKRGTTERTIYELALYTGQRRGDIAKMTWADVKDGGVNVVQEKNGHEALDPVSPIPGR